MQCAAVTSHLGLIRVAPQYVVVLIKPKVQY